MLHRIPRTNRYIELFDKSTQICIFGFIYHFEFCVHYFMKIHGIKMQMTVTEPILIWQQLCTLFRDNLFHIIIKIKGSILVKICMSR